MAQDVGLAYVGQPHVHRWCHCCCCSMSAAAAAIVLLVVTLSAPRHATPGSLFDSSRCIVNAWRATETSAEHRIIPASPAADACVVRTVLHCVIYCIHDSAAVKLWYTISHVEWRQEGVNVQAGVGAAATRRVGKTIFGVIDKFLFGQQPQPRMKSKHFYLPFLPARIYSDGSGKRCKLSRKVLGWWSPADKRVLVHFQQRKHRRWLDRSSEKCPGDTAAQPGVKVSFRLVLFCTSFKYYFE